MRKSTSRKKAKLRKHKRGTRKNGGPRKNGGALGATLNAGETRIMIENFLLLLDWDEKEQEERYPGVNFDSVEMYNLIKDNEEFQEMASNVCNEQVINLLDIHPNLETNGALRKHLLTYIYNSGNCNVEYARKRINGQTMVSPFVENLHEINVILNQFAIENFQGGQNMEYPKMNLAITNLKSLERSLSEGTFTGDVNAQLLEYLTVFIKNLPIRKWKLNTTKDGMNKYCNSLALDICSVDSGCKTTSQRGQRSKCVASDTTGQPDILPHFKDLPSEAEEEEEEEEQFFDAPQ
jgi:hypothetical protein